MRGTIKIGSKMVELLANGATPIRYKQLFKKDLLRILIQNSETDKERRKLLDDAAAEFRGQHTPEEAKRLIEGFLGNGHRDGLSLIPTAPRRPR